MKIALIAHDKKKNTMIQLAIKYQDVLADHELYATGTTGKLIQNEYYLSEMPNISVWDEESYNETLNEHYKDKVIRLLSGPLGGDQQIGAMVAEGKIDVVIFFCDNLITQGHQQDVGALVRLASLYNIPFATNRTTADMILTSPLFNNKEYERKVPSAIQNYANRTL